MRLQRLCKVSKWCVQSILSLALIIKYFQSIKNSSFKYKAKVIFYDFRIKTMFGSSLPPVVCKMAHILFTIFVFACAYVVSNTYCVVLLFFFILCTLCCQFLWMVHFSLTRRCSLTFIQNSECFFLQSCLSHDSCRKTERKTSQWEEINRF